MTNTAIKSYDNGRTYAVCADHGQGRVHTSYTLEIEPLALSEFLKYADFQGLDEQQAEKQVLFLSVFAEGNGKAWEVTGGNDYELFSSLKDARDYCKSCNC